MVLDAIGFPVIHRENIRLVPQYRERIATQKRIHQRVALAIRRIRPNIAALLDPVRFVEGIGAAAAIGARRTPNVLGVVITIQIQRTAHRVNFAVIVPPEIGRAFKAVIAILRILQQFRPPSHLFQDQVDMLEALAEDIDRIGHWVAPGFLLDAGRTHGDIAECPARVRIVGDAVRQAVDRAKGGRIHEASQIAADMRARILPGRESEKVRRQQPFAIPLPQSAEHFLNLGPDAVILQVAIFVRRPESRHHAPSAKDGIERAIPGVDLAIGGDAERRAFAALAHIRRNKSGHHRVQFLYRSRRAHTDGVEPILPDPQHLVVLRRLLDIGHAHLAPVDLRQAPGDAIAEAHRLLQPDRMRDLVPNIGNVFNQVIVQQLGIDLQRHRLHEIGQFIAGDGEIVFLQDLALIVRPGECQLPIDAGDRGVQAREGRILDVVAIGEFPGTAPAACDRHRRIDWHALGDRRQGRRPAARIVRAARMQVSRDLAHALRQRRRQARAHHHRRRQTCAAQPHEVPPRRLQIRSVVGESLVHRNSSRKSLDPFSNGR